MSSDRRPTAHRCSRLERTVIAASAVAALAALVAGVPAVAALAIVLPIASLEIRSVIRAAGTVPPSRGVRIVDETVSAHTSICGGDREVRG
jgi:hypothetical protein